MFVISVAISANAISYIATTNLDPIVLLFGMTIVAIVYFHILNAPNIVTIYSNILRKSKTEFLYINILILINWSCNIYGTIYSTASISKLSFFLSLGLCGLALSKNHDYFLKTRVTMLTGIALLLCVMYNNYVYGILISLAGGISGIAYGYFTEIISEKAKLNTSETLMMRFWMMLIVLFFLLPNDFQNQLSFDNIVNIIFIAFTALILQVWLNQKSIFIEGNLASSLIKSTVPLATFLLQGILTSEWEKTILVISVLVPLICQYDDFKKCFTTLMRK